MVSCCLLSGDDDDWNTSGDDIPRLWHRDIGEHYFGQFSFAMLQGNQVVEDKSQVEVADGSVFCGVYDGHGGGVHASTYFLDNLYSTFRRLVRERGMISEYTILNAFIDTENGFLDTVQREFRANENIAPCASCCLVGILRGRTLHYANLGNSRAVLGYVGCCGHISAEQLTQDHDDSDKKFRRGYEATQSGRDGVVVKVVNGMRRVNGLLTVSSCIGDGISKRDNLAIQRGNLHIPGKSRRPLLNAVPSVQARELRLADRFVIFASDGLWKILSNQEAARVVHNGPRQGAAERLVKKALRRRADQLGWTYDHLKEVLINERYTYIDDISVIVLFVDHGLPESGKAVPAHSERSVDEAAQLLLNNPAENPEGLSNEKSLSYAY